MHPQHKGDSPLFRFLRDPGHSLAHALTAAGQLLERHLPLLLVLVGLALALLLARLMLTRVGERRLARGARLIPVAMPPQLEPEGALLLWSAHDLLRPRYARMLAGQPQRAWEIAGDRGGSQFRIWVPGSVPPGLVERALASAWPGITTTALPAELGLGVTAESGADEEDILLPGSGEDEAFAAGELVLSGPGWFPLGGRDGPDPLRLVLGQLAGLSVR